MKREDSRGREYNIMPNANTVVVLDFETTGLSPREGAFHRALYDSEMAAKLWSAMLDDVRERYVLSMIDFGLMQKLAKTPKHAVDRFWKATSI